MASYKKGLNKLTVQESQNAKLGQAGAVIIDGTDEIAGPFIAVMALEDSVVDTSQCDVTWLSGTIPGTFKIPDAIPDAADLYQLTSFSSSAGRSGINSAI